MIIQEKTEQSLPQSAAADDMKSTGMARTTDSRPSLEVEPPNYDQATASTSVPVTVDHLDNTENQAKDSPSPPAPSNLVHVFRRDGSIRGEWNIDPDLVIPAAFLANEHERAQAMANTSGWPFGKKEAEGAQGEEKKKEEASNLTLHTRDGRIQADVWITDSSGGAADSKKEVKPTTLDLYTRDGDVTLRLRSKGRRPVRIKIYTHDGRIRVFLPRAFVGLIVHKLYDGKLIFSSAMQPSVSTFSLIDGKKGSTFIGDWRQATAMGPGGEASLDAWEGDQCEVTTKDGSIYFFWDNEYEGVMSKSKSGWFTSLFSS